MSAIRLMRMKDRPLLSYQYAYMKYIETHPGAQVSYKKQMVSTQFRAQNRC